MVGPGGWSPHELSSQMDPDLEMSRTEPQAGFSEQVRPALHNPAISPTLGTSSQARPYQDEPSGVRATL